MSDADIVSLEIARLKRLNSLLRLQVDMQRDIIANLRARLYNDFDMAADVPVLCRPQAE
jgi:hypothetical protein